MHIIIPVFHKVGYMLAMYLYKPLLGDFTKGSMILLIVLLKRNMIVRDVIKTGIRFIILTGSI